MKDILQRLTRSEGVINKPAKPDRSMHKMIEAVLAYRSGSAPNSMPVKLRRSRLLNVKVNGADPRNAIVVRNKIFAFAIGTQHIHVTSAPLADDPALTDCMKKLLASYAYGSAALPDSDFFSGCFSKSTPITFYNYTYPLDWRSCYSTVTVRQPFFARLGYVQCDNRIVKKVETHYTLVSPVCRQLYHETGLLPYYANELAFDSPETLVAWFDNRKPEQKRAMGPIWYNIEWFCGTEGLRIMDRCMASMRPPNIHSMTIKVSRLTLRTAIEEYCRNHSHLAGLGMRPLLDTEMILAQLVPCVDFVG